MLLYGGLRERLEIFYKTYVKPGSPQGAALYDPSGWKLNSWGKLGHNIQAWFCLNLDCDQIFDLI